VLRREVDTGHLSEELKRPNWILLREGDDFEEQLKRLVDAIDVDFEWVNLHARLAVRAREWERSGEDGSLLLRGSELADAERWLHSQGTHAEAPTPEHGRYIVASRQAATRRQHLFLGAVAAALVVSIGLTIFAVLQAREARSQRAQAQQQRDRALSRALAANSTSKVHVDPELSLVLAMEAVKRSSTTQAREALRQSLGAARWRKIIRPPGGHLDAADLSPDARLVVTANRRPSAAIWDSATGRRLRDLTGHRAVVGSAEFSPDSRHVITTAHDGSARIWDARTGRSLTVLPGDRDRRPSDDFEPFADFAAGGRLAYAVGRRFTRLWDVRRGRVVAKLRVPGPEFGVDVDVSADGRRIATTRLLENVTQVWDVQTGRVLHSLRGDEAFTARFSPDGRRIVTGGGFARDGHIWDVESGRRLHALHAGADVEVDSANFSRDGTRIVAIFLNDAYVFDARTGKSIARLRGHRDGVNSAAFSPDGRRVLTAAADGTARIWDARTGRIDDVLRGHTRALASADYSRDGRTIATLSEDGTVRVWDAVRDALEMRPANGAEDAEFSPDGRLVVPSSDEAPVLGVWNAATGHPVKTLTVPGTTLGEARFSPRGDVLAAADEGHGVRLWSTRGWAPKATIDLDDLVSDFRFSHDGRRLLATTFDDALTVSDVSTGQRVARFTAPNIEAAELGPAGDEIVGVWSDVKNIGTTTYFRGRVSSWGIGTGSAPRLWHAEDERTLSDIETSRDGRLMLVSGPEHAVVLNAVTHKVVATIKEPDSESGLLNAAHFGPDGARVITADDDNLARIWDGRTGRQLLDLAGHASAVQDARLSPDGRVAATISEDGTSRVWDARTGATVQVFSGLAHGTVAGVRFSPDGGRVLTADGETVRIFRCVLCVPVDRQLALARGLVARALSAAERRASGLS
jgi:WD40 repeat protein